MIIKNPCITVMSPHDRIYVHGSVIEYLGSPDYVCLFQTPKRDKIALGACKNKHPMSFRVIKHHGSMAYICSKKYVHDIMALNGLSDAKDYRIVGKLEENPRLVSFVISEACEIDKYLECSNK